MLASTLFRRVPARPLSVARQFSQVSFSPNEVAVLESLKGKSLKKIDDYSAEELKAMLSYSHKLKWMHKNGTLPEVLKQQSVSMIFQKRSTRTRVSTETGMSLLGGHSLFLSSDDVQLGVNESLRDSAIVLSRFNSLILARVFGHDIVDELVEHSTAPVINALSDLHHPLQILADFMTLQEQFGEDLSNLNLAWVGDGNNVLHDIMLGAPLMGMNLSIATPPGYEPNAEVMDSARASASTFNTSLMTTHEPKQAINGCNVVFTDTWVSMGEEEQAKQKLKAFEGYRITNELMEQGKASADWRFMHCLPRHQEEVDDEVFYSDKSVVFDEAENRMYTVMAVMSVMLGKLAV